MYSSGQLQGLRALSEHGVVKRFVVPTRQISECLWVFALFFDWVEKNACTSQRFRILFKSEIFQALYDDQSYLDIFLLSSDTWYMIYVTMFSCIFAIYMYGHIKDSQRDWLQLVWQLSWQSNASELQKSLGFILFKLEVFQPLFSLLRKVHT